MPDLPSVPGYDISGGVYSPSFVRGANSSLTHGRNLGSKYRLLGSGAGHRSGRPGMHKNNYAGYNHARRNARWARTTRGTTRVAQTLRNNVVPKMSSLTRVFGRTLRAVGNVGLKRAPLLTIGLTAFGIGAMRGLYEGAEAPYMPGLEPGSYKQRNRGMQSNHLSTEGLTLALHANRHR